MKTFASVKPTIVIITDADPSFKKATIRKIMGETMAKNI